LIGSVGAKGFKGSTVVVVAMFRYEQDALNRITIILPGFPDATGISPLVREAGLTGELPPLRLDLWSFDEVSPPAVPFAARIEAAPQILNC